MKDLIEIKNIPKIPEDWNYEISVKRANVFIYKWKNLTVDLAYELWIARKKLSVKSKERERAAIGTFVPVDKNWSSYCKDIGVEKRTVNRWLKRWFKPKLKRQEYKK